MSPAQLDLFDAPRPGDYRRSDGLPSRKAAAMGLTARQNQKKEIARRLARGPATARDLRDITDGQQNRVSKRLGEMVAAGLVREVAYTDDRPPLTVYALTDAGHRDLELIAGGHQ